MMSELSARILSSIAIKAPTVPNNDVGAPKKSQSPRKKRIPPYAKFPAYPCPPPPSVGSSGYLADNDALGNASTLVALAPPGSIDLDSSRQSSKRFAIPEVKPLYKRHKPSPQEEQYNTTRVFLDLAAGNIEVPKVQPNRPRIFPARSGVNLAAVRLVSAKDVIETPILSLNPAICSMAFQDFQYDFSVIASLAYDVSILYREIEKKELSNAALRSIKDAASTHQAQDHRDSCSSSGSEGSATSSFTESASDGVPSNEGNTAETAFFTATEVKLSEIASIGQVMSLSNTPRLLISSSSPHQILQVNAAFHRFSEAFSFLGKTASDLTTEQNLLKAIVKAGTERRSFKTRIQQFQWENSRPTTVSIYPVGPDKGSVITHFAIEVVDEDGSTAPMSRQNSQAAVPGHVVVTG